MDESGAGTHQTQPDGLERVVECYVPSLDGQVDGPLCMISINGYHAFYALHGAAHVPILARFWVPLAQYGPESDNSGLARESVSHQAAGAVATGGYNVSS